MSRNNRRRWIAPWKNSGSKPEIYHSVGRVVGRGFLLGEEERQHFRMLMRMCEKFTGCRVLTYCLMSNHFHIFLEVTPIPEGGITDEVLFQRLGVFYGEAQVAEIAREMEEAGSAGVGLNFCVASLHGFQERTYLHLRPEARSAQHLAVFRDVSRLHPRAR